jgi:hypothetical protein
MTEIEIEIEKQKHRQFKFREVVADLRYDYFCIAMKKGYSESQSKKQLREKEVDDSILEVASAITESKILPIVLFYRCYMEWKRNI